MRPDELKKQPVIFEQYLLFLVFLRHKSPFVITRYADLTLLD